MWDFFLNFQIKKMSLLLQHENSQPKNSGVILRTDSSWALYFPVGEKSDFNNNFASYSICE